MNHELQFILKSTFWFIKHSSYFILLNKTMQKVLCTQRRPIATLMSRFEHFQNCRRVEHKVQGQETFRSR